MAYRGVLFDLYGTLVRPFRKREHGEALAECARLLGAPPQELRERFNAGYATRIRGEASTGAEDLVRVARALGARPSSAVIAAAQDVFTNFVAEGLSPIPSALPLLETLRAQGLALGLVSNCAGDVPRIFPGSALAPLLQVTVFSSDVGLVKPEPGIYRAALAAMGCRPEEVLYVGDGSDGELSGAAACGMHPVLVEVDLSNTYDDKRKDVDAWSGERVAALSKIADLLAP